MSEEQRPFGSARFAGLRSQQDAGNSNDNTRAAAQASILINGGAATAVLAFLSKDHVSDYFNRYVPMAIVGYALGVFAGACMVYFAGQALRYWSMSWREYMVHGVSAKSKSDDFFKRANRWSAKAEASFAAAMFFFC